MPLKQIKTSYNAGEISEYMAGRTDINKYHNACSQLINATVLPHGGVVKRPGTEFIAKAKEFTAWQATTTYPVGATVISSDNYYYCKTAHTSGATFASTNWDDEGSSTAGSKSRLIPFEFSVDDVLMLEFGLRYIRFYTSGARVFETAVDIDGITLTGSNTVKISTDGAHGYTTGNTVKFTSVGGTTELNGKEYVVTYVDADDIALDGTDSSDFTAWTTGGTVKKVYETTSPYNSAEIFEMHFTQSADVVYIAHEDHHPQKLSRTSNTSWAIADVSFTGGPFLDENTDDDYIMQFTGTATEYASGTQDGGDDKAILTDSGESWTTSVFVGLYVHNTTDGSVGLITANSATTITAALTGGVDNNWDDGDTFTVGYTANYIDAGRTGTLEANDRDGGSNNAPFLATHVDSLWLLKQTRDDNSTTTADSDTNATPTDLINAVKTKGDYIFETSTFAGTDSSKLWRKKGNGEWHVHRTFTAAAAYSATEEDDDVYYAWTRSAGTIVGGFTCKDPIHRGVVKVTVRTDTDTVTVEAITDLLVTTNTNVTPITSMWAEGAWSDYRGFPRTVGFFEDRLWWISSTNDPDTLWASKSSDYENMEETDLGLDDDSVVFPLNDSEVSQIQWMMARQVMAIGAANKEYKFGATDRDKPVTPSDRKAVPQTSLGSHTIQPAILNNAIFFFQRPGRKLQAMKFDAITENFIADDVTMLANTLFESSPICMAVQRIPDSIVWVVRTDGVLLSFTYEPVEEVAGWARHITQNTVSVDTPVGEFESVAVIHGSVEDEVWVTVKREINASTVRYIEKFATRYFDEIDEAMMLDSAVVVSSTYDAQDLVLASDTVRCNNGECNSSLCGGATA